PRGDAGAYDAAWSRRTREGPACSARRHPARWPPRSTPAQARPFPARTCPASRPGRWCRRNVSRLAATALGKKGVVERLAVDDRLRPPGRLGRGVDASLELSIAS